MDALKSVGQPNTTTRAGAITKLKRLSDGQSNGTILRFAYRKVDVQRRMFTIFWDFCCSYHQIIAAWILVSEGQNKKGGFVETNSSEYCISTSKMQGIFESDFASRTIK